MEDPQQPVHDSYLFTLYFIYNNFDRDNKCVNLRMIEDEIIFSVNLTEDSINKLTAFVKMIMVIITLNTSNY